MTLEWYGIGCGGSICLPFAIFNGRLPHFVSGLGIHGEMARTLLLPLLLPPPSHRQDVHHSDVVS